MQISIFFLLYRARTWTIACGREDLLGEDKILHGAYRVCGAHFETRMFANDLQNRLHPNAVPTIFPTLEGGSSQLNEHSYCIFNSPPLVAESDEHSEPSCKIRKIDTSSKICVLQNISISCKYFFKKFPIFLCYSNIH